MATKRHYHSDKSEHIRIIKLRILASFGISLLVLVSFVFFGPRIGYFFKFLTNSSTENKYEIPPPAPVFDNPPKGSGRNNITLKGYSKAGTTVKLYLNGPEVQSVIASTEGTFEFDSINLNRGRNTIYAKAIDQTGLESDRSENLSIVFDEDSPEIEITTPEDGSTIRNLNERIEISGKLNEKATLKINDRLAPLKPDNSFEFLLGVEEGEQTITIVAVDEAGNETKEELTITYRKSGS